MHVSILFYERLCDSENPPKDIELRNFSFVLTLVSGAHPSEN